MFSKLHRKMALFCTFFTGIILAALSLACFFFAQNSICQNNYASFLKELSTLMANLQKENSISHQWLNQLQENHHLMLFLYDNGNPLFYQQLQADSNIRSNEHLPDLAIETARTRYGLDLFKSPASLVPQHEEFSLSAQGLDYYASAGVLPKGNGRLSFVILYSLEEQSQQVSLLRSVILCADGAGLLLLFFFAWLFTGHLLKPLEISRKQQSQFIASASHELRSPLSVMLSGLESLEKADKPEEKRRFIRIIRSEGRRMQHLISDMLLLANSDSGNLRLHLSLQQPDELLFQVYEAYQELARKKQISLGLLLPEEPFPDCLWDGERIRQLIAILLDNALAYTPARKSVLLFLHSEGPRLLLGVADQGPGIPESEKEQIFRRFYRAESSRTDKEHFGLGLCVAKEIVLAHQGQICVKSSSELELMFDSFHPEIEAPSEEPNISPSLLGHPLLQKFCAEKAGGSLFLVKLPAEVSPSVLHFPSE